MTIQSPYNDIDMLHRRGNAFGFAVEILNGTTPISLADKEIDMYLLDDRGETVANPTTNDYLQLTMSNTRLVLNSAFIEVLDELPAGSYRYELRIIQTGGNRSLMTGKFSIVEPTHVLGISAQVQHANNLIQVSQNPDDYLVQINSIYVFGLENKADLVNGKVPAGQLPSYVDDVQEYSSIADFPATGEAGKIYIATDTNLQYRWSGSAYILMTSGSANWGSINGNINTQSDLMAIINGINSAIAGKYSSTNPNGYISGITEGMVIAALGFQPLAMVSEDNVLDALGFMPYNGTTNPNGYINELAIGPVGTNPSIYALEYVEGALMLQPANQTYPGVLTAGAQNIGGGKTFMGTSTADNTFSAQFAGNNGTVLAVFKDGGTFCINNTFGAEIMQFNGSMRLGASRNCTVRPSTDLGATMNTNSQGLFVGYMTNSTASGYPLVTLGMSGSNAHTTGSSGLVRIHGGFSQSSGANSWEMLRLSGTINQSGTANGTIRCIQVNPTITAAANLRFLDLESPRTSANDTMLRIANNGGNIMEVRGNRTMGFFGVTPVVRQTGGVASAGASYTATEQTMLNAVYSALRNYGLLT